MQLAAENERTIARTNRIPGRHRGHRSAGERERAGSGEGRARRDRRAQQGPAARHAARHQHRPRRVHRGLAARGAHRALHLVHARARGDVRVPRQLARHADSGGHHSDLDPGGLRRHERAGLHAERAHAARHGARHRPRGGRCHRGAGEHLPAHRARRAEPARRHRWQPRDRLRGHRDHARAVRGVRAHLVPRRARRAAVQRVRLHARRIHPVLLPHRAHAHADADVAAVPQGAPRAAR